MEAIWGDTALSLALEPGDKFSCGCQEGGKRNLPLYFQGPVGTFLSCPHVPHQKSAPRAGGRNISSQPPACAPRSSWRSQVEAHPGRVSPLLPQIPPYTCFPGRDALALGAPRAAGMLKGFGKGLPGGTHTCSHSPTDLASGDQAQDRAWGSRAGGPLLLLDLTTLATQCHLASRPQPYPSSCDLPSDLQRLLPPGLSRAQGKPQWVPCVYATMLAVGLLLLHLQTRGIWTSSFTSNLVFIFKKRMGL